MAGDLQVGVAFVGVEFVVPMAVATKSRPGPTGVVDLLDDVPQLGIDVVGCEGGGVSLEEDTVDDGFGP